MADELEEASRWSPDRWLSWEKVLRSFGITVTGFFLLLNEFVIQPVPRTAGWMAGLLCLGLPAAMGADEILKARRR